MANFLRWFPSIAMASLMCSSHTIAKAKPAAREHSAKIVTERSLIELNDIGPNGDLGDTRLFSVSPDGKWLAFQQRRADVDANNYSLSMKVLALDRALSVRSVDRGGELLRIALDGFGRTDYATGVAHPIVPQWHPGSRWFAYLKREHGITQVWRATVNGKQGAPLTHSAIDVTNFALSPDGTRLVIQTRPGLIAARDAIAREGRTGYHVDKRSFPISSPEPFPSATIEPITTAIDLATGDLRAAAASEAALFDRPSFQSVTPPLSVDSPSGELAVTKVSVPSRTFTSEIVATAADGRRIPCASARCRGSLRGPWSNADGRSVLFLRREGWAESQNGLYRWTPGLGAPRLLLRTESLLESCEAWRSGLICLSQSALSPRHLVYIDTAHPSIRILHDPNPDFGRHRLGKAVREHWTNAQGIPVFGDVVLPVGYRRGRRYPLIVVQYETRGFLRGGTGDEFPIQLFAEHGYIVLSMQGPRPLGLDTGRDYQDIDRIGLRDFGDRRSVLSAIEVKIADLVKRGLVDPAKIGITGLSEGAASVQFAALNSGWFKAGIMSGCCWGREQDALLGAGITDTFHEIGWPKMIEPASAFWGQISLSENKSRFPLLLNMSEDEYLMALFPLVSQRQRHVPVDMFVYPNERHVKWQPAHRLAIYRRNLAWFDYWLAGKTPFEPAWQSSLADWDRYRLGTVNTRAEVFGLNNPQPKLPNGRPSSPPREAAAGVHGEAAVPGRSAVPPVRPRDVR